MFSHPGAILLKSLLDCGSRQREDETNERQRHTDAISQPVSLRRRRHQQRRAAEQRRSEARIRRLRTGNPAPCARR